MCDKSEDKIFGKVKREHWWFLQHFHMCKLKDEDQQAMWRLSVMIVQRTKNRLWLVRPRWYAPNVLVKINLLWWCYPLSLRCAYLYIMIQVFMKNVLFHRNIWKKSTFSIYLYRVPRSKNEPTTTSTNTDFLCVPDYIMMIIMMYQLCLL